MRCWLVNVVLVVVPAISSADDQTATPITKAWVETQLRNLDADRLSERLMAESALLKAGPPVLELLPAPELLANTSVRQAVRRIRIKLETAKARESVKASAVTLTQSATLEQILAMIADQTGNDLTYGHLPTAMLQKKLTVNFRKESFWNALAFLAEQMEIAWTVSPEVDRSALKIVPQSEGSTVRIGQSVGPFWVSVSPPKLRRNFLDDNGQLLRVYLQITVEPRLRPLFLKLRGRDFTAKTKSGKTLPPFNPDAKLELPLGERGTETSFSLDFVVPKPFDADAVVLSGKAQMTVAAGTEEIMFSKITGADGTARRRGGVTVRLDEIAFRDTKDQTDHHDARLRVTVYYDTGGPAFESHRTWMFHNRVYLTDSKKQPIERNGDFETALQTDGGVIVEYKFPNLSKAAGPYRFHYEAPTLIINVPFEFRFEKLPLADAATVSK